MKHERLKWFRIAAIAVPLLMILVFANCYYDPANLFHNVSRAIADSLLDGNATYIASGNMNERRVKQYIIEDMPDDVECVALGSSLMFGIRREHVGTESFYNLGISGADFYDIMAQFGLMELNGKKPDRVIICVDTYLLNDTLNEAFTRNIPLKPYAQYMLEVLEGKAAGTPKADNRSENWEKIKQMFSVANFQAAVEYIVKNRSLDIPRWGIVDENYQGLYSYYVADGSMKYPTSFLDNTEEDVRKEAVGYDINYHFTAGEHISPSKAAIFEKMITVLQEQGTEVVLFLCPMCPTLWDRINENTNPILGEVENYITELAENYGLKLEGSLNPHNMGMSDADFYDSRHLRHELLEVYFDFE